MKNFIFTDKPTKLRTAAFITMLVFWYHTCILSALTVTDETYFLIISHILNWLGEKSQLFSVVLLITLFFLLFCSLFNRKIFVFMWSAVFVDSLASVLLFYPDMIRPGYKARRMIDPDFVYYYDFISPFIPENIQSLLLNYSTRETIASIYVAICGIGTMVSCMLFVIETNPKLPKN